MKWEILTQPVAPPVTYQEAKARLRLDTDDEQTLVEDLILMATEYAEAATQRSIVPRTLRATYYASEQGSWHPPLPMGPVIAVTEVTDQHGDTLDTSAYEVRREGTGDYLYPKRGGYPLTVTYTAGYSTVPERLKGGILMHVVTGFETRGATTERRQYPTPYGLDAMYAMFRAGGGIG